MPDASGLSVAIGPPRGSGDNEAPGRSDCRTAPPASRRSQLGAERPEVGEAGLVERRFEILRPGGSAGDRLSADGALDHVHVSVAPLVYALSQVHEALE